MNGNAFIKRIAHVEIDGFVEKIPNFTTGKAGIFLTCVGITFNLLNMYTDIALGLDYLLNGDYWWAILTLMFVLLSSFLISIFTFSLHHKSNGKFLTKINVSKPLIYTLCAILHGHLARCLMWLKLLYQRVPLIGVKAALWIFRDITSYAEVFIESIPQLCLQCYVVLIFRGEYNNLQLVSIIASWLSASWGLLSQFDGFKWKLVAFELNLFWFAARALAVALLASVNKVAACLIIAVHFLFMLPLWFWQNSYRPFSKKKNVSRFQVVITDIFYSTIYATCNSATPITCNYTLLLSFLLAFENIMCYLLAYYLGEITRDKTHFHKYKDDYDDFKCDINARRCTVPFKDWRYGKLCMVAGCFITAVAWLQVLLIKLLKYIKMLEGEAMVSQLGSCSFRRKLRKKCPPLDIIESSIYVSNPNTSSHENVSRPPLFKNFDDDDKDGMSTINNHIPKIDNCISEVTDGDRVTDTNSNDTHEK